MIAAWFSMGFNSKFLLNKTYSSLIWLNLHTGLAVNWSFSLLVCGRLHPVVYESWTDVIYHRTKAPWVAMAWKELLCLLQAPL